MHRVLKYWQKFLLFIVLFLLFINELPDIVNDVTDDRVNHEDHEEATDKEDTEEDTDNIIIYADDNTPTTADKDPLVLQAKTQKEVDLASLFCSCLLYFTVNRSSNKLVSEK